MSDSAVAAAGSRRTATIFGVSITVCTLGEGIDMLEEMIASPGSKLLVLANAHTLNLAYERGDYRKALREAGLVLRDGSGMSWALRRRGIDPLHNFVGTDFIPDLCRHTAHKGYRFYILGARPGISEIVASRLGSIAPGITVAGHRHGYFREDEEGEVIDEINSAHPDILLVAMGNPRQEIWIAKNLGRLRVPVCIGVGALFDYMSGQVPRAPQWMLRAGLEWVFRLLVEPRRLWRRYVVGNPKFIMRVLRELHEKSPREYG